ncbi:MAG TPA: hypothetical protein VFJ20_01925, partial [Gemmatimonadaceae bacterium]|nr:hypothetical protein [Gemmatimonadaceae bacterium]
GHIANDKMILVGTRSNANVRTVTAQTGDAGLTPDLTNGDAVVAWSFSTTPTPATTIVVER